MANIYKQQQTSDLYNQVYSAQGNPAELILRQGQELEKESKNYLSEAQKDYSAGIKITMNSGLNQLANDPKLASNPQELSKEMDKLMKKTMSEVVDDNVKRDALVSYYTKKDSYVNKAQNEFIKRKNQEQKEFAFVGIEDAYNDFNRTVSNLLSDANTADDIVEYFDSIGRFNNLIESKNISGQSVFTPYQQHTLRKQFANMQKNAVINHINGLDAQDRYVFLNNIINDEANVVVGYEKSDDGIVVKRGNISNHLSPEDYSYIKGIAQKTLGKYRKLKPSDGKNSGLSEEQAIELAQAQTMNNITFSNELSEIGKLDDDKKKVLSLFDVRNRMINEYKKGNIDEKDYKKLFEKTIVPLVESADKLSGTNSWFYDSAFTDGVHSLKQIEGITPTEKAYLYTRLYDTLVKDGIELDSGDNKDARRVKQIVEELKKDYTEKKASNVIGTNVNKVLLGTDVVLDYNKQEEKKTKNTKYRLWKKGDKLYKVYPDENGNFTNNSAVEEVFERG